MLYGKLLDMIILKFVKNILCFFYNKQRIFSNFVQSMNIAYVTRNICLALYEDLLYIFLFDLYNRINIMQYSFHKSYNIYVIQYLSSYNKYNNKTCRTTFICLQLIFK